MGSPGCTSTQYECQHNCQAAKPDGTYRGVSISENFLRGEYAFTFYTDNTLHWRAPDGKTAVTTLKGGAEHVEDGATALDGVITKSDDPSILGKSIFVIMKKDEIPGSSDGIAKYVFQGLDFSPVATFDAAMTKSEWVMVGCMPNEDCDFSIVEVK